MLEAELMGQKTLEASIEREVIKLGGSGGGVGGITQEELEEALSIKADVEYVDNQVGEINVKLESKASSKDVNKVAQDLSDVVNNKLTKKADTEYVNQTYNSLSNVISGKADKSELSDKATINYVDTKIANLVGTAPETLDTLGEVAKAIQDNDGVVNALNSAIGNKADKTELNNYAKSQDVQTLSNKVTSLESSVPKFTAIQLEDGSYSLTIGG